MFIKQLNYRIKTEYIISYLKNISNSQHVGLEKKLLTAKTRIPVAYLEAKVYTNVRFFRGIIL